MFNTTQIKLGSTSQTVLFNTPSSGMIQKSNPSSQFIRFGKGSKMEEWVFPSEGKIPCIKKRKDQYSSYESLGDITVLQVLIFGDNQYLCEIVFNKDIIV